MIGSIYILTSNSLLLKEVIFNQGRKSNKVNYSYKEKAFQYLLPTTYYRNFQILLVRKQKTKSKKHQLKSQPSKRWHAFALKIMDAPSPSFQLLLSIQRKDTIHSSFIIHYSSSIIHQQSISTSSIAKVSSFESC